MPTDREVTVRLTRSIRRKMALGLGLLLAVMILLLCSSLDGLKSYRNVIASLRISLRDAPRKDQLVASLGELWIPLSIDVPGPGGDEAARRDAAEAQMLHFQHGLDAVQRSIDRFGEQLASLPPSPHRHDQENSFRLLRNALRDHMKTLRYESAALADLEKREASLQWVIRELAGLYRILHKAPDPSDELIPMLNEANKQYQGHLAFVWFSGIAAVVLLFGLVVCGVRWVVLPIRCLHRGACQVAQGDYDVRIDLETNDEISELATAFNRMTERFQIDAAELDQKVRERSQQLVQSERLAGIGLLAAGVAHEINNPLAAIAMAAESLEFRFTELAEHADPADAEVIQSYLRMIQTESERCQGITRRLLDFARGQDSERNLYDVVAIVDEVIAMVSHLSKYADRTIDFQSSESIYAFINGAEIKQVVLNLVANALDAMNAGGVLTIGIRTLPDHVELRFQDTGCGMTKEIREHIFDPFYTTKEVGKGTGLGLSISHRIVVDHHGTLEAESEGLGKGSTFRLRLPRNKAAAAA